MSLSNNFPAIKPSLNLDFANVKALDPRITFTRTTTATYYDGVTTAKAEENLLLQSEDFNNASWALNTGITVSVNTADTTAPDGTSTADKVTANASATANPRAIQSYTLSSECVFSVFAKKGTHDYIQLLTNAAGSGFVNFDLNAGTASATTASGSITSVGNGWYRCVAVFVASTPTNFQIQLAASAAATRAQTWNAAGTEDVYLWGAQLEQRSAVSAYTPTTTQQITNYIPVLQTAASGVARYDHNPTTGESLGLLVEEQRTNLFTYSAEFDNAAWTKTRSSITANTIVAPDGTLTGDKLVENTDNNTHLCTQSLTLTASTSYVATVYVKAAERTRVRLQNSSVANWASAGNAYFDLSAGTVVSGTGVITPVGNGWYRCSITGTFGGSNANGGLNIFLIESGTTISYTGNGYSGIYIWGAQLEAGAFPTSYIATTSASVTRNADAASMTGTNFSSWFNAGEGTVYFESQTAQGTNSYPYSLFGSSTSNRIFANYGSNAKVDSGARINGTFEASVSTPNSSAPLNTFGKGATAYKVNDFGFSWNGAAALTDTSTTLPIIQELDIGNNGGLATNWLNGTIKKLAYYPSRLSDAQLQALTS